MRYDIVVIGGGPAGLSAAVQGRKRNKSVLVLCMDPRDAPLAKAEQVNNYLGMPNRTGSQMLGEFTSHATAVGAVCKKGRVLGVMPSEGGFLVGVGSEVEEAGAIILATGVQRGQKYPGEAQLLGAGVSYCATCDGMLYRGREVVVIGKSADAPEEANFLHGIGCHVTYVSGKAPEGLNPEIPFVKAAKTAVYGEGRVSGVEADGKRLPCEGVFILRPTLAPSDLLPGLKLAGDYVEVNRDMATNISGVFAAGDCTGLPLQISKAVGEGMVAGHRAAEYLDAQREGKDKA